MRSLSRRPATGARVQRFRAGGARVTRSMDERMLAGVKAVDSASVHELLLAGGSVETHRSVL